jgi:hypothetical protein
MSILRSKGKLDPFSGSTSDAMLNSTMPLKLYSTKTAKINGAIHMCP